MNHKFVWVDLADAVREFDPKTGEGPIIEAIADPALKRASEDCEDGPAQGVVKAVLGVDKIWRFAGHLTFKERAALGLFKNNAEREKFERTRR